MNLVQKYNKLSRRYASDKSVRQAYEKDLKQQRLELEKLRKKVVKQTKVATLAQLVADKTSYRVDNMLAQTITNALVEVFGDGFKITLKRSTRGKQGTCEILLETPEYKGALPIKMCHGTSVGEIIGAVIRIIVNGSNKPLFLDEPFSGLEVRNQEIIGAFIKTIVDKCNVQMMIISHRKALIDLADNVFDINKR